MRTLPKRILLCVIISLLLPFPCLLAQDENPNPSSPSNSQDTTKDTEDNDLLGEDEDPLAEDDSGLLGEDEDPLAEDDSSLLGDEDDPTYTSRTDLGLRLHAKALTNVIRERGQSVLEEIQQAVEDSKIES